MTEYSQLSAVEILHRVGAGERVEAEPSCRHLAAPSLVGREACSQVDGEGCGGSSAVAGMFVGTMSGAISDLRKKAREIEHWRETDTTSSISSWA